MQSWTDRMREVAEQGAAEREQAQRERAFLPEAPPEPGVDWNAWLHASGQGAGVGRAEERFQRDWGSAHRPVPREVSEPERDWVRRWAGRDSWEAMAASPNGDLRLGLLESGYRPPTYGQFPLQEGQWLTGMKPENYLGPIAEQMARAYPGFRREWLPEISGVRVSVPSTELGLGERGMYTEPGRSQYPGGSIHLYGQDIPVELHEYAHALSVPKWGESQWRDFEAAKQRYLQRPDPEHWRLQTELRYGYGLTTPEEGYSEIARVSGGNLANVPYELRRFYPWLSVVPPPGGDLRWGSSTPPTYGPEQREAVRAALDLLNMTPQQVERVRQGLVNVERWGYNPNATADYIRKAQEVLRGADPWLVAAYGGWPRWLPR